MAEFDAASAAVQAALDAGARYADARVMHRRYESMSARNGDDRAAAQDENAGIGVRALVGSGWGFYAVPDLPTPRPARPAGGPRGSPRRARGCPARPSTSCRPRSARDAGSACAGRPAAVPLSDKGDLLSGPPRRGSTAPTGRGAVPDLGHPKWFVSSEGHRIDQHIRECGAGISATAIGDGETQRRSYPS